jgi:hypothetical protein
MEKERVTPETVVEPEKVRPKQEKRECAALEVAKEEKA